MRKSNNPAGRPIDRSHDDRVAALIVKGVNVRTLHIIHRINYTRIKRVEKERGLRLKVSPRQKPKPRPVVMPVVGPINYAAHARHLRW